ncbi:hypothetical protein [Bradyrhizobium sp. SZCCHNRI1009]|uniref:hypothetical protein n=1 Tax=Bradyrhizobium TaxID=374 RepID=UPI002915CF6C|nr:hypothetical protein [Bradyrhizobium sp. SZCCHNRI1009]
MTNDDEKNRTLDQTLPPKKKRKTIDELLALRDNEYNPSPRARYRLLRPFSEFKKLFGWREGGTSSDSEAEKIQSQDRGRATY